MADIPILRPGAVTPDWFNAILRENGVKATVKSFTAKNVGTGQIGDSVRFKLDYEGDPGDAPRSLVGKFPSPDDQSRGTGIGLGNYNREVQFYRHLADTALIKTPRIWFNDINPADHEFVVLMEDLAPAEQGDQLVGATLEQTRLSLLEAAKLHASHWNDPAIDELAWVSNTKAAPAGAASLEAVTGLWQAFCARYADRLDDECRAVGDRLVAAFGNQGRQHAPQCLAHNDYRLDNMMYGTPAGGYPLTVLDWQSLSFGCGASDVAYFLAGSLSREDRRKHEKDLLEEYRQHLLRLGVPSYDPKHLWEDYASHAFTLFTTAFFASMIVIQTPRGDDMFFRMLRGATDQILDLDSLSYIEA